MTIKVLRIFATIAVIGVIPAMAGPVITAEFDPAAGFTAADIAQVQAALNFYRTNITDTFSLTIAFGSTAGGGGASQWFSGLAGYNAYYNALLAHSSGDATDTSAIASLGGGAHTNNPVTGSTQVELTSTLGALLGLVSQSSSTFSGCGTLTANACITIGTDVLFGGPGGSPNAGLFGVVEHETDEVLGTASALPNGGGAIPTNPFVTDLFRYSAPGVRSFSTNPSTSVPCSGTPTAYLSVDGGVTNLNNYNNCNNGGDYGDWIGTDGLQVQDAFGPDNVAASLNLTSPEVKLLDATGYNFAAAAAVPEPSSFVLLLTALAVVPVLRRRGR